MVEETHRSPGLGKHEPPSRPTRKSQKRFLTPFRFPTVDGRAFKDVVEFKQIMLADEEQIARNLVERLILYSTGAPVSFADRAQVEAALDHARPGHFGLRSLIHEVIAMQLFRRK